MTGDDEVPVVAASEADLIRMARALVAPRAYDAASMFVRTRSMPPKISGRCADLVADALELLWPAVWRRGGARPSAWLAGDRVVRGRPWERQSPIGLAHSRATLAMLRWLVATRLGGAELATEPLERMPLTIGDELVVYLALDLTNGTPAQRGIARQPLVQGAALAWLGFTHVFAGCAPPEQRAFDALADGAGAIAIESLGTEIAGRWHEVEVGKRAITDPQALIALGAAQDATLVGFMAACDQRKRRDLATWVLDAAALSLERHLKPVPEALDPNTPLSARAAARRGAGALLRGVARWNEWDQQHRAVRFIDDDYQASQLLLARFERIGSGLADRAAGWLAELQALVPTTA